MNPTALRAQFLIGPIWVTGWLPFFRGNPSTNDALAAVTAAGLACLALRPVFARSARTVSATVATVAGSLALAGLAADWTLPSAIALTLLVFASVARTEPRADELRLYALLSLPWFATDVDALGLAFRHSAAWATSGVFSALGFSIVREGTMINLEGQPLSVAAACAGLDTLHATLVTGVWLAAGLRRRVLFWIAILTLPLLAWAANTARIIALGGVAITWGPDAASGWFHTWGGAAVIVVMFLFAGAWIALLRQKDIRT